MFTHGFVCINSRYTFSYLNVSSKCDIWEPMYFELHSGGSMEIGEGCGGVYCSIHKTFSANGAVDRATTGVCV